VRRTSDLMLLTTVTIWAFGFAVTKYVLDEGFRPLSYSSMRYGLAAILFAVIAVLLEGSLRIGRRELPLIVFCTAMLFVNQLCFVYSLEFTTATTAALLFGTLPVFTALFARGSGIEHLSGRFWLATVVSFAGVALVALGSGGELSANLKGDALAILGAATWAAYSVAIAPLMRRYSPYRLSAVFLLSVTVPLLAVGSVQLGDQAFDFKTLVWIGFAFAVLGPLVVTNLLWFRAIDRVGPSRASLFANLQPFLAAIVALILLSEEITLVQIGGGVAIAGGIALASERAIPPEPPGD
jgi:drug/metabolite transporter (DMT)-like permease